MQNVYDYLFLCTKIRAMEGSLLDKERMERMVNARSDQEAFAVLTECGYGEFLDMSVETINQVLEVGRQKTMDEVANAVPDAQIVDVFKLRYDYHNIKVLLKAEAMSQTPDTLLLDLGTIPAKVLETKVRTNDLNVLPYILRTAIAEAQDTLNTTRDPQLCDFVLDRAYFEHMTLMAKECESEFLKGYVRILIDTANLRTAIRTLRMGKNPEFLRDIIFPDGNISEARVLAAAVTSTSLSDLFSLSLLKKAAIEGAEAVAGARLTQFEKLCDDAIMTYLDPARYVPVGEAPVIAYLAARESELVAISIILTGRLSGIAPETIQERLRESYV